MLLSNQQIDYSSVRRMPTVKLSGQTQGTTVNTMPTSTSLQDISSHAQKFTWNNQMNTNENKNDQCLTNYSERSFPSNSPKLLHASHSDERIFEHPEVTIKPSELDDELQRRLVTMKTSNTKENLLENIDPPCESTILEHPDMRSPVVMQTIPSSTSSSALLFQDGYRRISRTQSADINSIAVATITKTNRTPSPGTGNHRVEFFIDTQSNSKRSVSPGLSLIDNINQNSDKEKNEHSQLSSNLTPSLLKTNDLW